MKNLPMKGALICLCTSIAALALSGCGNEVTTDVAGHVGLTRTSNGHLSALVATCGKPITQISVAATREGLKDKQQNPELGSYTASKATNGHIKVDLESGAQGWSVTRAFTPPKPPAQGIIVMANNRKANTETSQITVPWAQLKSLKPGQVLQDDGSSITTVNEAHFFDSACK